MYFFDDAGFQPQIRTFGFGRQLFPARSESAAAAAAAAADAGRLTSNLFASVLYAASRHMLGETLVGKELSADHTFYCGSFKKSIQPLAISIDPHPYRQKISCMGFSSRLKLRNAAEDASPCHHTKSVAVPTPATCPAVPKAVLTPAKLRPSPSAAADDIDQDISHAREIFATESDCTAADPKSSSKRARSTDEQASTTDDFAQAALKTSAAPIDIDSDDDPILCM
jgi:hypothetical protein